jgi:glutamate formiminotransferase
LGALDVMPFVALEDSDPARAAAAIHARAFGTWWAERFAVPVFFYDDADDARRDLPSVRRDAFGARRPDCGPGAPHPELGATAVGARRPLVAINCELATHHVGVARAIATRVRARDGGLPGVRALGFLLEDVGRAQVSMNLVDLERTGIEAACTAVRDAAQAAGTEVARVELVGLVPARELERCRPEFLAWSGLTAAATIEARLDRAGPDA